MSIQIPQHPAGQIPKIDTTKEWNTDVPIIIPKDFNIPGAYLIRKILYEGDVGELLCDILCMSDSDNPYFSIFLAKYDPKNAIAILRYLREFIEDNMPSENENDDVYFEEYNAMKEEVINLAKESNLYDAKMRVYQGDFSYEYE
jgi:hypothetical protein